MRMSIGDGIGLGVRLVLDECLPGGYDLDEGVEIALALEASSLFDYISTDVGIGASVHMVVPPMSVAEGYSEHAFARAAAALSLPVFAFGRIQTPAYAERIVAEGKAEVVGMARDLADPDWPRKAFAGKVGRIRPCTYCNQLCVGNAAKLLPVACTVNPAVGRVEAGPMAETGAGRVVVVVGGGPAGLEAARVAAEAGHEVTLFEASGDLGGQLAVAALARGREQWRRWIDWAASEPCSSRWTRGSAWRRPPTTFGRCRPTR